VSFGPPALVFAIPLIVYLPVLQIGFITDDFAFHVLFTFKLQDYINVIGMIRTGEVYVQILRPTGFASFQADYFLWGANAVGFHFTNIFFHSLNALLLYCLARILGLNRPGATLAGLVFGLYPGHAEPVVWVSGRFDVLAIFWLLTSFLLWLNGRIRRKPWMLVASGIAFFIAELAKESAAAGIFAFPLLDWMLATGTVAQKPDKRARGIRWYVLPLVFLIFYLGIRYWILGNIGAVGEGCNRTPYFAREFSELWQSAVLEDMKMLLTPINRLTWPDWEPVLKAGFIVSGISTAAMVFASFVRSLTPGKGNRESMIQMIAFSAWIIFAFLPVAPLDGVRDNLESSRLLYQPSTGLALLLGAAFGLAVRSSRLCRMILPALMILLLAFSVTALRSQESIWLESGRITGILTAEVETRMASAGSDYDLVLVNDPRTYKGAICGLGCYDAYLLWRYGQEHIRIFDTAKPPEIVDQWWNDINARRERPIYGFQWDDSTETLTMLPDLNEKPGEEK
jgi:hypothetical protein